MKKVTVCGEIKCMNGRDVDMRMCASCTKIKYAYLPGVEARNNLPGCAHVNLFSARPCVLAPLCSNSSKINKNCVKKTTTTLSLYLMHIRMYKKTQKTNRQCLAHSQRLLAVMKHIKSSLDEIACRCSRGA